MVEFILGFKALADWIPDIVGTPVEDEHHNPENGDGLQLTSKGLMVWRKADNFTAFTDGARTWISGPFGLQERANEERFPWELAPAVQDIIALLPVAPWNELKTRPVTDITMIVGHWDGGRIIPEGYDPIAYYQSEAFYHIAKDWGGGAHGYGLMYHEVIDRSGKIWIVRPPEHVVWAQTLANPFSYAIKLDATDGQPPTPAQMDAFRQRVDFNRGRFQISQDRVVGHGELTQYGNQTSCPGNDLLALIQSYRRG